MGRSRKSPPERRSERLECRLTPTEKVAVEAAAAAHGMTLTDYTYAKLTCYRVAPRQSRVEDALLVELSRIGNNLNQVARAANEGRFLPPDFRDLVAELRTTLERVAAQMPE